MPNQKNSNRVWILLLLLTFAGVFILGKSLAPPGEPLPQLPPETVTVTTVKTIEVPVEIQVPGPVRIVERVKWRTKTERVEVPVIKEVEKIVYRAAETGILDAWIDISAYKYEGLDPEDGEYKFGWRGYASCSIENEAGQATLTEKDFDLSQSLAESTIEPEPLRRRWTVDVRLGVVSSPGADIGVSWHRDSRWGLYAGWQKDFDTQQIILSDSSTYASFSPDSTRIYGGVSLRIGHR